MLLTCIVIIGEFGGIWSIGGIWSTFKKTSSCFSFFLKTRLVYLAINNDQSFLFPMLSFKGGQFNRGENHFFFSSKLVDLLTNNIYFENL